MTTMTQDNQDNAEMGGDLTADEKQKWDAAFHYVDAAIRKVLEARQEFSRLPDGKPGRAAESADGIAEDALDELKRLERRIKREVR